MSKRNRKPAEAEAAPVAPAQEIATIPQETAAPEPEAAAPAAPAKKTVEKDRPEQNGVKQPSAGGACRAVWDLCSDLRAATGDIPTVAQVKAHATERGWNTNNASIEYYCWRKFNGIRGRAAATKPVTTEATTEA